MGQLRKSQGYHWSGSAAVQAPKDWSRFCSWLCHYHLGVPATKIFWFQGSWGPIFGFDIYGDKDQDCGSSWTRLEKYPMYLAPHTRTPDRRQTMISCKLLLVWCDRLSLKSFTDSATDVCRTENPGHKWSTLTSWARTQMRSWLHKKCCRSHWVKCPLMKDDAKSICSQYLRPDCPIPKSQGWSLWRTLTGGNTDNSTTTQATWPHFSQELV